MDAAAKKWLQEYKKIFDRVAARNAGMNVLEDVTTVERKEEIKRIGKLVDELGGTATQVPKKVIKKIGKLVPDENAESNKKTASGTKVQDSGERFAIVAQEDGKLYVTATRKVIKSKTIEGQRKEISNFFDVLLNGQPSIDIHTIEGDVLTITKDQTADKARDNYKTVQSKRVKLTDEEFRVKLNAEAHIDELAGISKDKKQKVPDSKNHPFAKDGFTYRTAYFEDFDGKYYKITLSIGNNGTVATVYNVGEIKENVPSSAKIIAVMSSKALDETFSNDSIAQKSQNSNTSDKKSAKDFNSGERNALPDAKKTDKTIAKSEEKLAKKEIRLKAEYETDTVFSESGVKKRLATIDGYKALPASERGDIESRIWTELNESNGYDAREWLRLKWSVRLIDELVSQRGEAISRAERDIISKQVNQAIDGIVDSGRKSVRGRMEGEIRAELSDKIRNEATAKERIRSEIYQTLKKIEDKKTARKNVPLILSVFH